VLGFCFTLPLTDGGKEVLFGQRSHKPLQTICLETRDGGSGRELVALAEEEEEEDWSMSLAKELTI
jgi:hypothetical protein